MTEKKQLKRKIKVALKRKSKIFKRSITKKKDLISKKFNTSIKDKKINIGKSVKNFFDIRSFFFVIERLNILLFLFKATFIFLFNCFFLVIFKFIN